MVTPGNIKQPHPGGANTCTAAKFFRSIQNPISGHVCLTGKVPDPVAQTRPTDGVWNATRPLGDAVPGTAVAQEQKEERGGEGGGPTPRRHPRSPSSDAEGGGGCGGMQQEGGGREEPPQSSLSR